MRTEKKKNENKNYLSIGFENRVTAGLISWSGTEHRVLEDNRMERHVAVFQTF
jgi:hypothetical protein